MNFFVKFISLKQLDTLLKMKHESCGLLLNFTKKLFILSLNFTNFLKWK